jgi:hypothetical protein
MGSWTAVDVQEKGDSMRLNPQEVGFVFLPNGRYAYHSTLNYREAGTYRLQDDFLVAKDTTRTNTKERVVAIDRLTSDSLFLRMLEGKVERSMLLLKDR